MLGLDFSAHCTMDVSNPAGEGLNYPYRGFPAGTLRYIYVVFMLRGYVKIMLGFMLAYGEICSLFTDFHAHLRSSFSM